MGYYQLLNSRNATESSFTGAGNVYTTTDLGIFGADAIFSYITNTTDLTDIQRSLFLATPYFAKKSTDWTFKAGAILGSEFGNSSAFHFYPFFDGHYNLVDNYLILFAHVGGGVTPVTYKNISDENPFINPQSQFLNTNNAIIINGGLRGTLSHGTSFGVTAGFNKIKDMPLYVKDTTNKIPSFLLVYDNVNVFSIHGELAQQVYEKWRLTLKLDYNNYSTTSEARAWYQPAFKMALATTYNIANKFLLTADIFTHSERYIKTFDALGERKIDGLFDLNFGIDYRYSKIFSLFAHFNNISAYRYYAWEDYPTQRFNIMAGLSFSF
jgi:hypothetical protein